MLQLVVSYYSSKKMKDLPIGKKMIEPALCDFCWQVELSEYLTISVDINNLKLTGCNTE